MSQFIEMFGNPLSSIQKNELKKLGDCCQINPRRPSVSISDSDLVSFVPMPAVNEDGYIDGATNEEYGKVNAARKSKVDDNTARMQSIKQLGV